MNHTRQAPSYLAACSHVPLEAEHFRERKYALFVF